MVQKTYEWHPCNASNIGKPIIKEPILSTRNHYSQLRDEDGATDDGNRMAMETEQKWPSENRMTMKRGAERSPDNSQQSSKRRSFRPNVQLSQLNDQEDRQASQGEQGGAVQKNGKRIAPVNSHGSGILSPSWEVEAKGREDGTKKKNCPQISK